MWLVELCALWASLGLCLGSRGASALCCCCGYTGAWLGLFGVGAPLFHAASRSTLSILDRVQYEVLRAVLGWIRSTPVSILLSEAKEPPLGLRRSLLESLFILCNVSWRGSPLIPKLRLLSERVVRRGRGINSSKCGLLMAYEGVRWVAECVLLLGSATLFR